MTAEAAVPESTPRQIMRVERVTMQFGGVTSLADVSLHQDVGEILAVIGPNGAGKTSLFNCLTGVYHPQQGSITFTGENGTPVSLIGRRADRITRLGIARTFQNIRLFNALTAFENVKIGIESRQRTGPVGAMLSLPRTRREEREGDQIAASLLDFVGLRGRGNIVSNALAYGEQRRLEIARALGTAPQILLLDEPAAGTNQNEKRELEALIRRVRDERGITVLLIEHDMRLVMALADRVVVLNFGKVIASGRPAEVQRHPAVVEAYLGESAEAKEARAAEEPVAPEDGPAEPS
jgi:branched-chain amino acid transport system ATP-binding protein